MTDDEAIERIIESLGISTMKQWKAQVDADMLRKYGLQFDGQDLKPSRIPAAIRRLRKSPNKKRRKRTGKKRPFPKR